jgi:ABC-type multidrug transport system fused ATPase/permease subunit
MPPTDLTLLLRFASFLKPHRALFVFTLLFAVACSAAGVALPLLAGALINQLQAARSAVDLLQGQGASALSLVLVFLAQAVCSYQQVVFASKLSENVVRDMRLAAFSGLLLKPILFFDAARAGDMSSRVSKDINDIQELFTESVQDILLSAIEVAGALSAMVYLSWKLSALTLCVAPLTAALVLRYRGQVRRLAKHQASLMGDISAHVQETAAHIRTVRAFGGESRELDGMRAVCDRFLQAGIGLAKALAGQTVANRVLVWGAILLVLLYGFHLTGTGELNNGQLVAFLILAYKACQPVLLVSYATTLFQRGLSAAARVHELLAPRKPKAGPSPSEDLAPTGDVEFERVTFRYAGAPALVEFSLSIRAGEFLAVVGASGAGKSTLLKLLLGFYAPDRGRILFDGRDSAGLDLDQLRGHMAYVPQETMLFNRSVAENIAYAKPSAAQAEIEAAAAAAGALDFIAALPQGFATQVGELGSRLSGGERQRIALARGFLRDPRILLMDEPTANLDADNEALLKESMRRLAKGRTTILVAHRLSTIEHADRVAVLDAGRLVELGPPLELLRRRGAFFRLRQTADAASSETA